MECNHVLLRKRSRDLDCIPREDREPLPSRDTVRTLPEALEYLASALAAPSLKNDPRVAGIVHESTDHGKTVVSFLLHVMHGVVRGFRPRNRIEAASELLGHIARDEFARTQATGPSFPRRREPIPGPSPDKADPTVIPAEAGIQQGGDGDDADDQRTPAAPESSSRKGESSFPRRACPVPDTGREPIPGPSPDRADPTVIPAEAGIQQGGDGDDGDALEDPDPERGCYDIDRKITEAQRDPSHPIHKFVQAYDEVAAVFHGVDKKNDDDEEVRYWISGEVVDAYGKYIWEYAPAYPRSIRRKLRPKRRRRSREPGTAPKAESVWMKRPSDKMREEGIKPPKRTLMWI